MFVSIILLVGVVSYQVVVRLPYLLSVFIVQFLFYVPRFSLFFFFFKQKTAYEMRISDWSSDVCSSDLDHSHSVCLPGRDRADRARPPSRATSTPFERDPCRVSVKKRSGEQTSEPQSLMRIVDDVVCSKKKSKNKKEYESTCKQHLMIEVFTQNGSAHIRTPVTKAQ